MQFLAVLVNNSWQPLQKCIVNDLLFNLSRFSLSGNR